MPHLKYSPSGAERWLACPGSRSLPEPEENRSSPYAAEGTAAHALAARCWLSGENPRDAIGEVLSADGMQFTINEEMASAVQLYLDTIRAEILRLEKLGLQPAIDLEEFLVHPDFPNFGGTTDCAIHAAPHLTIIDLKYGAGIAVDAEQNPQLLCYAMLKDAVLSKQDAYVRTERFRVVIVQPRSHHETGPVRVWEPTDMEIVHHGKRVRAAMKEGGEFAAGDHCRWCPHKVNCPELQKLTLEMAKAEFSESVMTPEKAAETMAMAKPVQMYLDAVEEWAHGQMEKGVDVPGYKLVHRYGNRKYALGEEDIVRLCKNKGYGVKQIYVKELMSPAQLEKLTGKDFVSGLVERPLLGTTVVPGSDRRPKVERVSAAAEFGMEDLL